MTGNISYENLSDSLKQKLTESNVDIVNNLTTGGADKALSAEQGKVLNEKIENTVPEFGVERINEYHAVRRFPLFDGWESNDNYESLRFYLPNIEIRGDFRIRTSMNTAQGGGAEVRFNFYRFPADSTNGNTTDFGILSMSPLHAAYFWYPDSMSIGNESLGYRPFYRIYKKSRNHGLYVEIEFISASVNAGDVLEAITVEKTEVGNNSDTTPQQQSIFTHVGNSKQNLATAITGKGVPTSKDDTFATMVANINKIDTGKRVMTGNASATTDINKKWFTYANGSDSIQLPYITVTLPFKPLLIRAEVNISNSNGEFEVSEMYTKQDNWTDNGVKISRYRGTTGNFTSLNMRATVTSNSPTSYVVELPVSGFGYYYSWVAVEA